MRVLASDLTLSAETLKSRSVTTSARIETWRTPPPVRPSNVDVVALSDAARSAADEAAEQAAADEERDPLAGEPRLQRIGAGSAFLVDDADGDGRATNGAELAALDGDGWIDEGDAAWQRLRVWTPDARDALQGQVRATGVYLTEPGSLRTMRQLDLATEPATPSGDDV